MRYSIVLLLILVLGCTESDPLIDYVGKSWMFQACGSIALSPIIEEDIIYMYSRDGSIYSLYIPTGDLLWKTEPMKSNIYFLMKGTTTILAASLNTVYAFNPDSGEKLWELSLTWTITGVAVAEDVYITTQGSMLRVSKQDGTVVWEVDLPEYRAMKRMLYIFRDRLFVEETGDTIGCYSVDGERLWEFTTELSISPSPWIFGEKDTIFLLWGELQRVDIESGDSIWSLKRDKMFLNAVETENHLILWGKYTCLCLDRFSLKIVWEKPVDDFWFCLFGVHGDTSYLTSYQQSRNVINIFGGLVNALIVREQDGDSLVKVEDLIFSAAVHGDKALFSTEEGVTCFDITTGEELWNLRSQYYCRGVTLDEKRAYIGRDDGKLYCFPLDSPPPYEGPSTLIDYSEELGKIARIHIEYSLPYLHHEMRGRVGLVLENGFFSVSGYEDQLTGPGVESVDFDGTVNEGIVKDFFKSITDLYIDSEYSTFCGCYTADIRVVIILETGEKIVLESGNDLDNFMPWTVTFRGQKAVQYTRLISIAFDNLMSAVGWDHSHARDFYSWGFPETGLCQDSKNLLEF